MLTHISILLILAGAVIRGVWGESGYLELREGQTVAQFVDDRGARPLPFVLHLAKFEIETYGATPAAKSECGMDAAPAKAGDCCNQLVVQWTEKGLVRNLPINLNEDQVVGEGDAAFRVRILRYIPDFVIDMQTREVNSRSAEARNPAILVAVAGPGYTNHRWLFAKFPDFTMHTADGQPSGSSPLELVYVNHGQPAPRPPIAGPIKSFKSTLKVIERNAVAHEQTIEVNRPLSHGGYRFYQSGYNPRDLSYTALQVVKDPGVPVVYAGFSLMIAGLFIVFYLNPWLEGRKKP